MDAPKRSMNAQVPSRINNLTKGALRQSSLIVCTNFTTMKEKRMVWNAIDAPLSGTRLDQDAVRMGT